MKTGKRLIKAAASVITMGCAGLAMASGHTVNITPILEKVEVVHEGKPVVIQRVQNQKHQLASPYSKTSRPCPPFCIQPFTVAPGVETIGELELLGYLKKASKGDNSVMIVDSRTRDWVARGTIPGSVNIPWNSINVDYAEGFETAALSEEINKIFEARFGARPTKTGWDFSDAKTLVLFCNGAWCPQSPTNIKTLLARGYPPNKLKWYRGGVQAWVTFGLTIVKPVSR